MTRQEIEEKVKNFLVEELEFDEEKIKPEGKKRPVLTDVDKAFNMDEVKYTKYIISFK